MQSMFRLPWCTEIMSTKFTDKIALEKIRQASVVDMPMFQQLKRKRSESLDAVLSHPAPDKKLRSDSAGPPSPAVDAPSSGMLLAQASQQRPGDAPDCAASALDMAGRQTSDAGAVDGRASSNAPVNISSKPVLHPLSTTSRPSMMDSLFPNPLTPLQQTIENEFNMQILMKHNELRLIEQEIGKCQIALEQLRRCQLLPFPGTEKPSLSVTDGTGPAIAPPPGFSQPAHPAPYGVTDGPYSRHYRQWLLRDPLFDSMSMQATAPVDSHSDGRTTRYNGVPKKFISKPVQPSTRRSDSLQSLPNYPSPATKDKNSPLVLRRSTDGKLVKLICNNCHRGDFNSIQGFLNHCRIAHKIDYKSHDLAAIDCGHALDESELAKLPQETHALSAPKPVASRAASVSSTPVRSNFVHPFNTSSGFPASAPQINPTFPQPSSVRSLSQAGMPNLPISPFKPSAQAPRLSQLFAKHNYGGNLEQAVAAARQKIDIGREDVQSPDASQQSSPLHPFPGSDESGPHCHNPMNSATRPASRKGCRQPAQRPRPALLLASGSHLEEMTQSPNDTSSVTFSPHGADSNPGLVSDHEDDDHGSASEEEAPHRDIARPIPASRHCSDHMEIDMDESGEMDQHGVFIRRDSISGTETSGMRSGGVTKMGGGK